MKYADLISRIKEMSSRRLVQQAFCFTLVVLVMAGCGGAPAGQQGEIIGIKAQASME